jgi:hypothetical protein
LYFQWVVEIPPGFGVLSEEAGGGVEPVSPAKSAGVVFFAAFDLVSNRGSV